MNARKIAWQMLYAELRRREAPRHQGPDLDPELEWFGLLIKQAHDEGINDLSIMLELAGFGATFAQMTQNDPHEVAREISGRVMAEPKEEEEEEEEEDES